MPQRACPQCGSLLQSEQRETAGESVAVDVCPSGDGLFLDEGEVEQLTRGRELHPLLLDELSEDVGAPRQECPNCNEIMGSEALQLEDEGLELDVCTVCHGVWITQDELSMLESMVSERPPMGEEEMEGIWDEELPALERRQRIGELLGTLSPRER